ncbi:hypothetical protein M2139_002182 [Enterococcus sp. PF1-24]|nr:hypothetical protein [Enterococcus sp. PFB1-1]MDH6402282.1 hypothetical protein [Enterococcus sp. PF1-24]
MTYRIDFFKENTSLVSTDSQTVNIYVPVYDIDHYPNDKLFDKLCEYNIAEYSYEETTNIIDSIKYDYKQAYPILEDNFVP